MARQAVAWTVAVTLTLSGCAVWYVLDRFDGNAVLPADCAIVFGTAVRPVVQDGKIVYTAPGPGIIRRISAAADLYRAGKVKKVYLTGGLGEGMAESEARVMRRMAVVKGIALEDTRVEEESRSTWENIANTFPLMERCGSIVGVSDRYHLARIGLIAERAGRRISLYPAEPIPGRRFEAWSTLREAAGVMLLVLQGLVT